MESRKMKSARVGTVMSVLAIMALVVSACTPPAPTPTVTDFDSALRGNIHIDIFVAGDPAADPPTEDSSIPVDINVGGQATGTWSDAASGPFNASLAVNGGTFPLTVPNLPVLTVAYSVAEPASASGHFDPTTGVGSFDTTITVTVDSVDLLGPIAAPCNLDLNLSMAGRINPATGHASVIQEGFSVTPPATDDCGGLGAIFGDLLANPLNTNSATMSFNVGAA